MLSKGYFSPTEKDSKDNNKYVSSWRLLTLIHWTQNSFHPITSDVARLLDIYRNNHIYNANWDIHWYITRSRSLLRPHYGRLKKAVDNSRTLNLLNFILERLKALSYDNFKKVSKKFLLNHCFYSELLQSECPYTIWIKFSPKLFHSFVLWNYLLLKLLLFFVLFVHMKLFACDFTFTFLDLSI